MEKELVKLSDSQISTFNSCKMEYYYAYVKCLVPRKKKKSLSFGKIFHEGMEGLYAPPLNDINVNYALRMIDRAVANVDRSMFEQSDYDDLEWSEIVAKEMIRGIAKTWFKDDMKEGVKILEVEGEHIVPMINPDTHRKSKQFLFHVRADKIKIENGRFWLVEYKTTSSIDKNLEQRLKIDKQSLNYLYYLQGIYGVQFEGTIFRYLKKPGIKRLEKVPSTDADGIKIVIDRNGDRVLNNNGSPRQSADTAKGFYFKYRPETREEFFKRLEDEFTKDPDKYFHEFRIHMPQEDMIQSARELWIAGQDVAYVRKHGLYHKNTKNCLMINCSYIKLCAGSLDEDDVQNMFKKKEEEVDEQETPDSEGD